MYLQTVSTKTSLRIAQAGLSWYCLFLKKKKKKKKSLHLQGSVCYLTSCFNGQIVMEWHAYACDYIYIFTLLRTSNVFQCLVIFRLGKVPKLVFSCSD